MPYTVRQLLHLPRGTPVSLYDIAGVDRFESRMDVIEESIRVRIDSASQHLRGPSSRSAVRAIALLDKSRRRLTQPNLKSRYDQALRQQLSLERGTAPPSPPAPALPTSSSVDSSAHLDHEFAKAVLRADSALRRHLRLRRKHWPQRLLTRAGSLASAAITMIVTIAVLHVRGISLREVLVSPFARPPVMAPTPSPRAPFAGTQDDFDPQIEARDIPAQGSSDAPVERREPPVNAPPYLTTLPDSFELPKVFERSEVPLGACGGCKPENTIVTLKPVLPSDRPFAVSQDGAGWVVLDEVGLVCRFYPDKGGIFWQWASSDHDHWRRLRACRLTFKTGNSSKSVTLFTPAHIPPMNLSSGSGKFEVVLPETSIRWDDLILRIQFPPVIPKWFAMADAVAALPLGGTWQARGRDAGSRLQLVLATKLTDRLLTVEWQMTYRAWSSTELVVAADLQRRAMALGQEIPQLRSTVGQCSSVMDDANKAAASIQQRMANELSHTANARQAAAIRLLGQQQLRATYAAHEAAIRRKQRAQRSLRVAELQLARTKSLLDLSAQLATQPPMDTQITIKEDVTVDPFVLASSYAPKQEAASSWEPVRDKIELSGLAVEDAWQAARSVYGKRFGSQTDPPRLSALAEEILQEAANVQDDSARFVLLQLGAKVAGEAANIHLATTALDAFRAGFAVGDTSDLHAEVFFRAFRAVETHGSLRRHLDEVADFGLHALETVIQPEAHDIRARLIRQLETWAKTSREIRQRLESLSVGHPDGGEINDRSE